MMKRLPLALILAVSAGWATVDLNRQVDATNVLVNKGCSGTIIGDGYVLTADHCIMDQYDVVERDTIADDGTVKKEKVRVAKPGMVTRIFFHGPAEVQRNSYVFKIKASDNALDLALLKIEAKIPDLHPAPIACHDPIRGDTVFAVGNSFGILYSTVTKGIVSSVQRSYRDLRIAGDLGAATDSGEHGLVQHSAVIAPGNSGGALYDAQGRLAGVNVRGIPGGFSFAVPLGDVKRFLSENGLGKLWAGCK